METDRTSKEILPDDLCRLFADTYLVPSRYSSMGSTSVPGEGTIGSITLKSLDVNSANGYVFSNSELDRIFLTSNFLY